MTTLIKIGNYYYDEEEFHKVLAPRIKQYNEEDKTKLNEEKELNIKDFSLSISAQKPK